MCTVCVANWHQETYCIELLFWSHSTHVVIVSSHISTEPMLAVYSASFQRLFYNIITTDVFALVQNPSCAIYVQAIGSTISKIQIEVLRMCSF